MVKNNGTWKSFYYFDLCYGFLRLLPVNAPAIGIEDLKYHQRVD
jgi:hypothetical protein